MQGDGRDSHPKEANANRSTADYSAAVADDVNAEAELEPIDITNPDVVASAKRMYGKGGMFLAAGMLGLEKILQEKKKPESVQVQEAASEPVDVDADGITVPIDDSTSVNAPPLAPRPPLTTPRRKPRRR